MMDDLWSARDRASRLWCDEAQQRANVRRTTCTRERPRRRTRSTTRTAVLRPDGSLSVTRRPWMVVRTRRPATDARTLRTRAPRASVTVTVRAGQVARGEATGAAAPAGASAHGHAVSDLR